MEESMMEELREKLDFIKKCVNDDSLSDVSKWTVIVTLVNPKPVSDEALEWAKKVVERNHP